MLAVSEPRRHRDALRVRLRRPADARRRSATGSRTRGRRCGAGSPAASLAAVALLGATWLIAGVSSARRLHRPDDRAAVRGRRLGNVAHDPRASNLLVLALHAMACVAGFIAGSSLPLQAEQHRGISRAIHEHGGRIAIVFVIAATTFSLSAQAVVLGGETAAVAARLHTSPGDAARGPAAARADRADRAVPAARGVDHRQPPRRLGPAARGDDRDRRDRRCRCSSSRR